MSTEKPMNLDYAQPFSNTSDLVRSVPEISHKVAADKQERDKEFTDYSEEGENKKEIYYKKQSEQKMSRNEKAKYEEKQLRIIDYNRPLVIGFLQRKFANNYYVYKRIFTELKKRDPKFEPESMLDYGAGLGSATWAGIH